MTSSSDRPLHLIIRGILPVGIPTQGTSIGNRCLMQVTSTFNGYATSHCIPCCAALILIQVVSPGCLNHRSKKGKAQSAFYRALAPGNGPRSVGLSMIEAWALCFKKCHAHDAHGSFDWSQPWALPCLEGHPWAMHRKQSTRGHQTFQKPSPWGFRCRRPRQMAWNVYTKSWTLPQSLSPREKRVFHHLHHLPTTQGPSSHANMTFKSSPGLAACR